MTSVWLVVYPSEYESEGISSCWSTMEAAEAEKARLEQELYTRLMENPRWKAHLTKAETREEVARNTASRYSVRELAVDVRGAGG